MEIQFYLAIDGESNRYYIGKKSDTELYCISEETKKLTIIPNGGSSSNKFSVVGKCFDSENSKANAIVNATKQPEVKTESLRHLTCVVCPQMTSLFR